MDNMCWRYPRKRYGEEDFLRINAISSITIEFTPHSFVIHCSKHTKDNKKVSDSGFFRKVCFISLKPLGAENYYSPETRTTRRILWDV